MDLYLFVTHLFLTENDIKFYIIIKRKAYELLSERVYVQTFMWMDVAWLTPMLNMDPIGSSF